MSTRFYIPVATIAVDQECCHSFLEGVAAIEQGHAVGSRVLNHLDFLSHVAHAIKAHDFSRDRIPGQGFLVLPETVFEHVSAGDGEHRFDDLDDYILANHRGQVGCYLKREHAGETTTCAVVVYTREAYLADPEVSVSLPEEVEYVVVAVLASVSKDAPLTCERFVANLAGGNREALAWTANEIREMAQKVHAHWQRYSLVAG